MEDLTCGLECNANTGREISAILKAFPKRDCSTCDVVLLYVNANV